MNYDRCGRIAGIPWDEAFEGWGSGPAFKAQINGLNDPIE
jgi:hypothetical protein